MEKLDGPQKNTLIANNRIEIFLEAVSKTAEASKTCLTAEIRLGANALPDYISHRIRLFEKLKKEYDELASKNRKTICVDLPDYDRSIAETSWKTTPVDIACYLGSQALVKTIIVAKVDGELWDLDRPLEKSCSLEFLKFNTHEGKPTFWKSSAHVLGQAAELKFGCLLCLNTVTDDGFYYEFGGINSSGSNIAIKASDRNPLEEIARQIVTANQKFERLVVSKENLLEMFKYNKFKVHLISSKIDDGASATVYRCGPFIDLCTGPHMQSTGKIGIFEIGKEYSPDILWHAKIDSVHRIYGFSIPKEELLADLKNVQLEDEESSE